MLMQNVHFMPEEEACMSIRIGILGYGNLGRGVESAIRQNADMTLVGVFTRRNPETVRTAGAPVYALEKAAEMKDGLF